MVFRNLKLGEILVLLGIIIASSAIDIEVFIFSSILGLMVAIGIEFVICGIIILEPEIEPKHS